MAGRIPSLKESLVKCCYSCCCSLFTLFLIIISVKNSFGYYKPTISVEKFYASSLNMTSNDTLTNHTIFFDLKLINPNTGGRYVVYDALNITLYYGQNLSLPVANVSIPRFVQEDIKMHRSSNVIATGMPWEKAQLIVASNGTVVFMMALNTKIRYRELFWESKRHSIIVRGNVTVNDQGNMVKHKNKGVTLSSSAYLRVGYFAYSAGLITLLLLSFRL